MHTADTARVLIFSPNTKNGDTKFCISPGRPQFTEYL